MPNVEKENKLMSAWERRNLYSKKVADRNKSKIGSKNDGQLQPSKAIVERSGIIIQSSGKFAHIPSNTDPITKQAHVLQSTNRLYRFTAMSHPGTPVPKKKTVIKRPTPKPNNRKSIARRSSRTPKLLLTDKPSSRKRNQYIVPSKIDTGLKKKTTSKIKITPIIPTTSSSLFAVQNLENPQPGTSSANQLISELPQEIGIPVYAEAMQAKTPTKRKSFRNKTPKSILVLKNPKPSTSAIKTSTEILIKEQQLTDERQSKKRKASFNIIVTPFKTNSSTKRAKKMLKKDTEKIILLGKGLKKYKESLHQQTGENLPLNDKTSSENVDFPETGDELEDDVFSKATITPNDAQPIKKRSKSVAFKVPAGNYKTPNKLPRTPRNKLSLRMGLNNFATARGINSASLRHLHCLGKDLSDVKKKKMKRSLSTPTLKTPVLTHEQISPIQPSENDMDQALVELCNTIEQGLDILQAETWLDDIEDFYPQFKGKFLYWKIKALIEEKRGDYDSAINIYNEAVNKVSDEDAEKIEQAISQLMDRLPNKDNQVKNKENTVTPARVRMRKSTAIDASLAFNSALLKFANTKNSIKVQKACRSMSTPRTIHSILTPVRRSARLATSSNKSAIDLEEMDKDDLSRVLFTKNPFLD